MTSTHRDSTISMLQPYLGTDNHWLHALKKPNTDAMQAAGIGGR